MTDATDEDPEFVVISKENAEELAKAFDDQIDPFDQISPSLLSAKDIEALPIRPSYDAFLRRDFRPPPR